MLVMNHVLEFANTSIEAAGESCNISEASQNLAFSRSGDISPLWRNIQPVDAGLAKVRRQACWFRLIPLSMKSSHEAQCLWIEAYAGG